jgi:hypothetical protein
MEYKQIEYYPLSQDQSEQLIHMMKKEECPRALLHKCPWAPRFRGMR